MRSKNLSSKVNLNQILEGNVTALYAVQSVRQAKKMWRIPCQHGTQSFADLCADCAAMDAVDLNAVWILARHEGAVCSNST
jgi:hypothetical protein